MKWGFQTCRAPSPLEKIQFIFSEQMFIFSVFKSEKASEAAVMFRKTGSRRSQGQCVPPGSPFLPSLLLWKVPGSWPRDFQLLAT